MSGFPELYYAPFHEYPTGPSSWSAGYDDYSTYPFTRALSVPRRIQSGCLPRTTIPSTTLSLAPSVLPSPPCPEPLPEVRSLPLPVLPSPPCPTKSLPEIKSPSSSVTFPILSTVLTVITIMTHFYQINLLPPAIIHLARSPEFRYRHRYKSSRPT